MFLAARGTKQYLPSHHGPKSKWSPPQTKNYLLHLSWQHPLAAPQKGHLIDLVVQTNSFAGVISDPHFDGCGSDDDELSELWTEEFSQ